MEIDPGLEKIVFNKGNLTKLKMVKSKIDVILAKEGLEGLKKYVGESFLGLLAELLPELQKFFEFNLKQAIDKENINDYTENGSNVDRLQQDLKEKNNLLETVSTRLNHLYETLSSDFENSQ
jgi:hypothetical protein